MIGIAGTDLYRIHGAADRAVNRRTIITPQEVLRDLPQQTIKPLVINPMASERQQMFTSLDHQLSVIESYYGVSEITEKSRSLLVAASQTRLNPASTITGFVSPGSNFIADGIRQASLLSPFTRLVEYPVNISGSGDGATWITRIYNYLSGTPSDIENIKVGAATFNIKDVLLQPQQLRILFDKYKGVETGASRNSGFPLFRTEGSDKWYRFILQGQGILFKIRAYLYLNDFLEDSAHQMLYRYASNTDRNQYGSVGAKALLHNTQVSRIAQFSALSPTVFNSYLVSSIQSRNGRQTGLEPLSPVDTIQAFKLGTQQKNQGLAFVATALAILSVLKVAVPIALSLYNALKDDNPDAVTDQALQVLGTETSGPQDGDFDSAVVTTPNGGGVVSSGVSGPLAIGLGAVALGSYYMNKNKK